MKIWKLILSLLLVLMVLSLVGNSLALYFLLNKRYSKLKGISYPNKSFKQHVNSLNQFDVFESLEGALDVNEAERCSYT